MYKSLEELCKLETEQRKPFWKIVQEDDCRERGISADKAYEQMREMYRAMKAADENYDAKLIIAKKAAELVKDGDTVMLDASSSAYALIPFLAKKSNITVRSR